MGGGGKKKQTVGYRYKLGMHMVVCHGPVDAVQEIQVGDRTAWGDSSRAFLFTPHGLGRITINQPDLYGGDKREGGVVGDIDVLPGGMDQGRNDYLMSLLGSNIPAFRGVLSIVARKIQIAANNPYIKPWAVRVRRFNAGWYNDQPWMPHLAEIYTGHPLGDSTWIGMNPAHIIVQCLTDPHWGMGFPMSSIGYSFWSAAQTLADELFGLNFLWSRQQPIESFIAQVLDHIGGVLYLLGGQFELHLLRDNYDFNELPVYGPDEIIRIERFERPQWGELPNEITVVYTDWETGGEATVSVHNLASIQLQGGIISQRRDYPGVSWPPLAARLALRDLRALGHPLARIRMVASVDRIRTEPRPIPMPGEVVLIDWPRIGIEKMPVRVVSTSWDWASGEARIDAVEDGFGFQQPGIAVAPAPPVASTPQALPPALVVAVELPYWELARRMSAADLDYLADTATYVGALACAGGAGQLNWMLGVGQSNDLNEVAEEDYAPRFVIHAALPATEESVDIATTPQSHADRLSVGDYAYLVDDAGQIREAVAILSYDANTGTMGIARGVLDTTPQAHAAGTQLVGVGEWLAYESTEMAPNESVYIAAAPRTTISTGAWVMASNGNPLLLTGRQARPYPPGRIRLNGQANPTVVAGDLTITWAHRDRTQQTAYMVHQDAGDIGPEPGTTYTVRIHDSQGTLVRSATGITGTAWTWDVAAAAQDAGVAGDAVTIAIVSVRDGWESWQAQVRTTSRAGYGLRWGQYWGGA